MTAPTSRPRVAGDSSLTKQHPTKFATPGPSPFGCRLAQRPSRMKRARRGIAAVLAMMFLILFGSLSVAMAIASKGNITTAATNLHVGRAQSAAETGLAIARSRLREAARRFVVSRSDVTDEFGWALWTGDLGELGEVDILPPATGRQDLSDPASLAEALAQVHALDQDIATDAGISEPTIGNALPNADDSEYMLTDWVYTPAVAIEERHGDEDAPDPLSFSVTYAPLANGTDIRAIVTGYDFAYQRGGTPITRTIMQDFRMVKRVEHAIIAPSKIMVGKNVMITGDLGCRYNAVIHNDGDPLLMRSDFQGLSTVLDDKLDDLFAAIEAADIDGDNRLRVSHPTEGAAIPAGTTDYNGDGQPDDAFLDVTGDGFVDEFDVFIKQFDTNGDNRITLPSVYTVGTPAAGLSPELVSSGGADLDNDLALLIDSANPDRNRNGIYGFIDANRNGRWDSGEVMLDYDVNNNTYRDQVLGFRDGFVDRKDQYAKIRGELKFKTTAAAWQSAQGALDPKMRGPIIAGRNKAPVTFNVGDDHLPPVDVTMFSTEQSALMSAADGAAFTTQVASNRGVSVAALTGFVETRAAGSTQPRYLRLDADTNNDSLPDNHASAYFEKMPYNSPSYSDFYFRPVYENMVFKDVQIPVGTNALFKNCTFVGVTYVRTTSTNTSAIWSEYGKLSLNSSTGRPQPSPLRDIYGDQSGETYYPTMLPSTARPPARMILMADTPIDKGDIPSNEVATTQGYNLLPEPLIIDGLRVTDTKIYSNNIRFHDCLFVGSIVSDAPSNYTQSRNKMQFTGATRFVQQHPDSPDDPALNPESIDKAEIEKSSMMLPNYSVDIGTFNSPTNQDVALRGAIIAGVMDVRGNASIDGALLLTFAPTLGQGPLVDSQGNPIGNPAGFNTTLGYFGPADGDEESLDPNTLPIVGGVKIVGWDTNGDGLPDVAPTSPQPSGSTAVPFNGYGRITLRFDPNMTLPSGIKLPMHFDELPGSYREGLPCR